MGIFTFEREHTVPVTAASLFKALAFDSTVILPKVSENIKSIEILEGNGDVGTLKKTTFVKKDGKVCCTKSKVDAIDKDNLVYNYTVLESDLLPVYVEKVSWETKLVPTPDGGTTVKGTVKYFTKGDAQMKEEDIKNGREEAGGLFKAIQAYLVANPDYK